MNNSIQVIDDVADAADNIQKSPEKFEEADREEERGEANVSAEVGSNADLDLVDEDLLRDEQTRATGFVTLKIYSARRASTDFVLYERFIGKASEIQWLRKLHTDGGNDKYAGPYGPPGHDSEAVNDRLAALRHRQKMNPSPLMHTSKVSFYLDDEILETDFMVDPFALPPFETAEKLLQAYMESCHNTFPFLAKKVFISQFYHCKLSSIYQRNVSTHILAKHFYIKLADYVNFGKINCKY